MIWAVPGDVRAQDVGQRALSWRFLQPTRFHQSLMGWEANNIEVRVGARYDTITGVTFPDPIQLADTALLGLVEDSTGDRRLFSFSASTRRITYHPLPLDLWHWFTDVSISPDGRLVVYLAASDTFEQPVVRKWPSGPVLARGPTRPECECDVDRHHAHWVTADSFELATKIGNGRWLRVSGSAPRWLIHVDTLRAEPQWR